MFPKYVIILELPLTAMHMVLSNGYCFLSHLLSSIDGSYTKEHGLWRQKLCPYQLMLLVDLYKACMSSKLGTPKFFLILYLTWRAKMTLYNTLFLLLWSFFHITSSSYLISLSPTTAFSGFHFFFFWYKLVNSLFQIVNLNQSMCANS